MATVLTISSPTAFRSNAIPLATTRAGLSTPVVQKQNAPASLTLEEKADKLLLKTRLRMRVEEVRGAADALEKVSGSTFCPPIDASGSWEIAARPSWSNHFDNEKAMLPRPREALRGTRRPPRVISHS